MKISRDNVDDDDDNNDQMVKYEIKANKNYKYILLS